MDDWTFLDEVDVISKWSQEHKKMVFEGGKWSERRDGLEALNKIIEDNPKLSTETMTIYGELMDELRKILDRESNIVVVATAAKTVELLAKGLRTKFGGYVGMVFPFLIKRAKDKKKNVRDAVASSLNAVAETTNSERILKDIVDWFTIPSPESKQTLLEFLYNYLIKMFDVDMSFIKIVAPLIVKCASESDANVREKSYMAIGSLQRLLGEASKPLIAPIITDQSKMEKVNQYEKQAKDEWEKFNEKRAQLKGINEKTEGNENCEENGQNSICNSTEKVIDSWTLMEAEDVTKNLDKSVEKQLIDKAWKERLAGCELLKKEIDAVGRIEISERLKEIMTVLLRIIEKDVNVNVAASAANILTGVAVKSRFAFSSVACKGFPICLEKLKDRKAILRDALNELIDSASTTVPLGSYEESVIAAISSKNPQTRGQTVAFVGRLFAKNDQTTMDVNGLKAISESISKASNDADKEVRDLSIRCVASIVKCAGEPVARRIFSEIFEDTSKEKKIEEIVEEIKKEYGKEASFEMKLLAKQYGIGSNEIKKEKVEVKKRPGVVSSRPTTATSRPMLNHQARPATSASRVIAKNKERPVDKIPSKSKPVIDIQSAVVKPKPFVARPAPKFGNAASNSNRSIATRPVTAGVIKSSAKDVGGVNRNDSVIRGASNMISRNSKPVGKPEPIRPNVVRTLKTVAPPNSAGSGIPRPQFCSTKPPLKIGLKNDLTPISNIRPPSRGQSRDDINKI